MHRTASLVAVGLVAVTSTAAVAAPTHAASHSARTVVTSYTAATTAFTSNGNVQGSGVEVEAFSPQQRDYGFVQLRLRRADRSVTLSLQDTTHQVAAAVVGQTTRTGKFVQLATFCGRTSRPLRLIAGGGTLIVRPAYTVCGSTPSVPTTGTIRAVLTSG